MGWASALCPPSIAARRNVSNNISRSRQIAKGTADATPVFFALYTEFCYCVWSAGPEGMYGAFRAEGDANSRIVWGFEFVGAANYLIKSDFGLGRAIKSEFI